MRGGGTGGGGGVPRYLIFDLFRGVIYLIFGCFFFGGGGQIGISDI